MFIRNNSWVRKNYFLNDNATLLLRCMATLPCCQRETTLLNSCLLSWIKKKLKKKTHQLFKENFCSVHSRPCPCANGAHFLAWAQENSIPGSGGRIKFVADLNFEWRKPIINGMRLSAKKVRRIFSPNSDMKESFSLANSGA